MGLSFFDFFKPKNGKTETVPVSDVVCGELMSAALDYQLRELSFWSCVNWIANAIARCEVRVWQKGEEVRGMEYYLWNFEPNVNQNSTAFWHKAIARLYQDNELLIVPIRRRNGQETVAVADDWDEPVWAPSRQNEYKNVRVWETTFTGKIFREEDVLHLKLNHCDMRPVLNGLYESYFKLVQAAMNAYGWQNGQHWKVHVSQIAQGAENWEASFQKMIEAQIKPFLKAGGAVLPEFDGYKYENVGGTDKSYVKDSRDIKNMIDDIFGLTARCFGVADVLLSGKVEATSDAMQRTLSGVIDPICDQFSEEATRKRFGYEGWKEGSYLRMDSSNIQHFDLFGHAANIEKLLGSGWSLNEIRRAAGEQPIKEPWADEHLITKNIGRLDVVVAQEGGNDNG